VWQVCAALGYLDKDTRLQPYYLHKNSKSQNGDWHSSDGDCRHASEHCKEHNKNLDGRKSKHGCSKKFFSDCNTGNNALRVMKYARDHGVPRYEPGEQFMPDSGNQFCPSGAQKACFEKVVTLFDEPCEGMSEQIGRAIAKYKVPVVFSMRSSIKIPSLRSASGNTLETIWDHRYRLDRDALLPGGDLMAMSMFGSGGSSRTPKPPQIEKSYHTMVCFGYDDTKDELLIKNSWGEVRNRISYKMIEEHCQAAHVGVGICYRR